MLLRELTSGSANPCQRISFPPSALKSLRSGLVELITDAIFASAKLMSRSKSSVWKSQLAFSKAMNLKKSPPRNVCGPAINADQLAPPLREPPADSLPRTGERIYPGLERGSESAGGSLSGGASWSALIAGPQTFLGGDFFKFMAFENASWDFHTLDFDRDISFADAKMASVINSTSPDLSDFKALGGKLILWHGLADPLVNSRNSINYYQGVVAFMHEQHEEDFSRAARGPAKETEDFVRLFMAPGMAHCSGGPGLNTFDTLTALERWVEEGAAPDKLIASHTTLPFPNNVMTKTPPPGDFSRPLCPWPQSARWTGKGSARDAANFVCKRRGPDRDDDDD